MAETGKACNEDSDAKPKWRFNPDTVSAEIRGAAVRMIADSQVPGSQPGAALNVFLGEYLPWPYRATAGKAFDSTGAESPEFESLIYTYPDAIDRVTADNLACAIDVHEKLGLEELRQSYEKIVQVKVLAKSPVPSVAQGPPVACAVSSKSSALMRYSRGCCTMFPLLKFL